MTTWYIYYCNEKTTYHTNIVWTNRARPVRSCLSWYCSTNSCWIRRNSTWRILWREWKFAYRRFSSRYSQKWYWLSAVTALHTSLTNKTKYQLLTKPFRLDKKYTFPSQRGKNGTIRRFMDTWLVQHPCLSYSPYYERPFCSACSLFSPLVLRESTTIFVHYPCSRFRHL
jgi:hypothetical protein